MSISTIDILPGNGGGTFRAPVALSVDVAAGLHQLAAGDFNGDGRIDLILNSHQTYARQSPVLLLLPGNGDGTFAAPIPIEGLTQLGALAAGDLNGDGMLDLVVAAPRRGLLFLAGNGDGTLGPITRFGASDFQGFAVADPDGDQKPDLIISHAGGVAVPWTSTEQRPPTP